MGLTVHFEVLNQLGTPMLYSSTLATRPAAGIIGRIFYRTDSPFGIYRDNGVTWDFIANSGTGTGAVFAVDTANGGYDKCVAYWQDTTGGGADTFDINANKSFSYDYVNGFVGIGTYTPANRLVIDGDANYLVAINNSGSNNTLLKFRESSNDKWTIGNKRSENSSFVITDEVNSINRLKIFNTGELDQLGWIVNTNSATGLSGTSATAQPNSSFTNNFTFTSNFSSSASVNIIVADFDNNLIVPGACTINNTSYNTSILGRTIYTFGSAFGSSLTMTQASGGIRALTGEQLIYIQSGTNSGTISHYANLQIFGDQKISTGLTTFTNRYQILLNDYNDFAAGFTYTNRWAIYQVGSSNTNYFNGKIITGSSTTISTYQLDVTGTSRFTGQSLITGSTTASSGSAVGVTISPTLVASANSDKLNALSIQATFTNGGFTSVTNMPFSIVTAGASDVHRIGTTTSYVNSTYNSDGTTAQDYITHSSTGTSGKIYQFATGGSTTPGISFLSTNEMGISTNGTSLNISDCSSAFPGNRKVSFFRASGSVMIQNSGTFTEVTSAMLNVSSTTRGFLPPVMTTTQKNAIATPAAGLIVFDTTLAKLCVYSGSAWQTITSV